MTVVATGPELLKDVEADARREDGSGRNDAGEWVDATGIPDAVRDDGAGEVGDDRGEGEEAVSVTVVARGELGQQRVADLALYRTAAAGVVAEVLVEEKLHAETDVTVDDGDGFGGTLALAVTGDVCAPAGGLIAGLGVKRAGGRANEAVEAIGVFRVVHQKIVRCRADVRDAIDEKYGVERGGLLLRLRGWGGGRMLLQGFRRRGYRCLRRILAATALRGGRGGSGDRGRLGEKVIGRERSPEKRGEREQQRLSHGSDEAS